MSEDVYQHFKKDEREIIDKIENLIAKAELNFQPVLTNFFNPRERYIARNLIGRYPDIKMAEFGGFKHAERKRILFYPNYFQFVKQDFEIAVLEIKYPKKFTVLHHGQILGTLVNAGIKRAVLGDIITDGDNWQIITEQKMSSYLIDQINKIGKINVRLVPQKLKMVLNPLNEWEQQQLLVSSLRLDSLIAHAYQISRTKVKELIVNQKVQVNWGLSSQPDYQVDQYDVISVRGYGRIRLDQVIGETRKQKIKINVSVIKK